MRLSRALALLALAGCQPEPGTPITAWSVADVEADAPPLSPDAPPPLSLAPARPTLVRARGRTPVALWMRAHVAVPTDARDPVVLVPRTYVAMAAYVDGARVVALDDYRRASGVPFHVVPLPRDRDEVELTLRVVSRYTTVGVPEPPRVGDRSELLASLVARDVPRLALGIVLVAIGLAASALAAQRRERRAWLGIALFSFAMGSWSLFQTRGRQLWLPSLETWFALWWLAGSLISAGAALFVDAVFGPGPYRFVRALWITFLAHAALSALALALPDSAFDAVAAPLWLGGRGLAVLATFAVLAFVVSRARAELDARVVVAGFVLAACGVLHDIAVSSGALRDGILLADVGYLCVELALIAIVVRRIRAMERQVVDYAASLDRFVRERDAMVRDLHDGLGGVVTNVRLLAEGAREQPERHAPALERIASLADEGLSELRTLMTGFDGLPASYRELGAELRRRGSTLLEPHGVEHTFEAALAEGALPAPDLSRYVALARIHREAIVNVIKHARATRVRVRLEVTEDALALVVEDDGRGVGDGAFRTADGSGRGLPSMEARARSIGATLRVEAAEPRGTRVTLRARAPA